jgi:hypothetical protein
MNRVRLSYRQLTAVCAVLVLSLVHGTTVVPAVASTPSILAVEEPNLANEERILEQYFNDLVAYQKACAQLSKKPSVLQADIDPLERKSTDLQRRLTEVQNALREVIKKLKAADKWNSLDTDVLANATNPGERKLFQESSFKADLEDAAGTLTSRSKEIDIPVGNLRKKLARTFSTDEGGAFIVRAAYSTPAPFVFVSLACSVGKVRLGLIKRLGGRATNQTLDTVSCSCNPGAGIGNATGTACSQVLAN